MSKRTGYEVVVRGGVDEDTGKPVLLTRDQARRIADLESSLRSYKQLLVRIRGELAGITEDLK